MGIGSDRGNLRPACDPGGEPGSVDLAGPAGGVSRGACELRSKISVTPNLGISVPFVWGFSAKWLPVFLGLRPTRGKILLAAVGINTTAIAAAFVGWTGFAVFGLVAAAVVAMIALGLFARCEKPAKLNGVHSSLPLFVRLSYVWALVAAVLGVWANFTGNAHGIWGASRHALTVGFLSTMVFAIGQRVLPAFSGMKLLFSTKLMFAALSLLTLGCALRVTSEVLAIRVSCTRPGHGSPSLP